MIIIAMGNALAFISDTFSVLVKKLTLVLLVHVRTYVRTTYFVCVCVCVCVCVHVCVHVCAFIYFVSYFHVTTMKPRNHLCLY